MQPLISVMPKGCCVAAAGMSTDSFSDFVVGHGELWCAQLLSSALQQAGLDAAFMDTREVLVVSPASDGTTVDVEYPASNAKLDAWAHTNGAPQVCPLPACHHMSHHKGIRLEHSTAQPIPYGLLFLTPQATSEMGMLSLALFQSFVVNSHASN